MLQERARSEKVMLSGLLRGEDAAFATLVDELHGPLLALAGTFASSPSLCEDIVQETWLAVIRGLRAFEGRSSLRTWIFGILVRRARTLASRERRRAGVRMGPAGADPGEPAEEWQFGAGRLGLWEERPEPWGLENPVTAFQMGQALEILEQAVAALPDAQRQVVLLRDVEDMPAADICNILEISETNQRVLLHRGRARIRRALDHYFRGEMVRKSPEGSVDAVLRAAGASSCSRGGYAAELGDP